MITKVCVTCHSEYEVETKRAKKHCSPECRYAAQKASFAKRIAEDPDYRKVVTARSRRLESERYHHDPEYNARRKEHFKQKSKRDNLRRAEKAIADPALYILEGIRGRAKSKGQDFNLTIEDIVIPKDGLCPILRIPLIVLAPKGKRGNAMSVDRIDSSLGYVKGNVAIISVKANAIKNNGTIEDHYAVIAYMKHHQGLPH